ncbi:MAG: DUF1735 domain-containing protein [Bacteroidales bacterium]|nr:DUF1735 domain-containing protein [Bacteroidales bacterium]
MKKLTSFLLILATCLMVFSCKKDEAAGGGSTSKVAVLSIVVNDLPAIVEVPQHQTLPFETQVASNPGPESALQITLGADESLVASYNAAHGTSYQMLPATAFEFSSGQLLLSRYNKKSTKGSLSLKGEDCTPDQVYLLPVVIKAVSGSAAYEKSGAAYVLVKVTGSTVEGSGTQADPYLITNVEELAQIEYLLVPAQTTYFKLMDNIDMEDVEWTGIDCVYYDPTTFEPDESKTKLISLDGNGKKISNFSGKGGFFTTLRGNVQNLTFDQATITGGSAGVLARQAGSNATPTVLIAKNVTVTNSTVTSTGDGSAQRNGGLISHMLGGVVENCSVSATVESDKPQTGGVIGRMEAGSVINTTFTGDVTKSSYYEGGLIGMLLTGEDASPVVIRGCRVVGNVTNVSDNNYSRAGGLIGQIEGDATIEGCSVSGNVSGNGHFAGGLIGVIKSRNSVTVSKSWYSGTLSNPDQNKAGYGSLIGRVADGTNLVGSVTISNCYATGKLKGFRWSSGFVGDIERGALTIVNGYSSVDLSEMKPDTNGNVEVGIVLGKVREPVYTTISCNGFVAWNLTERDFCFPDGAVSLTGNYYGSEGTVSEQATALHWDTSIWDLSGNQPTLKPTLN